MIPDLSEFTYGFALVNELIHWPGTSLSAAPYFPSLTAEGDLGYDVNLDRGGIPLFIQFKLSEYINSSRVWEVKNGKISKPFYRMKLHRRNKSRQHELMHDLEVAGHDVFYAAPEFHTLHEMNEACLRRQVQARSRFFIPSQIGLLPDDRPHHLAFAKGVPGFVFCSEPEAKDGSMPGQKFGEFIWRRLLSHSKDALTLEAQDQLADLMLKTLRIENLIYGKYFTSLREQRGPLALVSYLAQTYYGCILLVVQERHSSSSDR